MIIDSKTLELNAAMNAAAKICTAARTAPKGRGVDHIETAVITDEDKTALANELRRLKEEEGAADFFVRDAACVEKSLAVVLVGVFIRPRGLDCGLCRFSSCKECFQNSRVCSFDTIDFGIALGSAAASAADERVDTRIMYTGGVAAKKLHMLPKSDIIMAIPISVSGKSPFFDRG